MSNRTDIVVETDNAEGQVLLSASRVYDLTEDKTQDTINSEIKNTLNQLSTNVGKILPIITGTTNNSGYTIATGDYFEANGALYKANAYIPQGNSWASSATALNDPAINNLRAEVVTLSEYNGVPIKRAIVSIPAGSSAANSWTVLGNVPSDITGIILSVTICLASDYRYFNIPMYIRSGEFAIYNSLGGPIQFSNDSYLVIDYI